MHFSIISILSYSFHFQIFKLFYIPINLLNKQAEPGSPFLNKALFISFSTSIYKLLFTYPSQNFLITLSTHLTFIIFLQHHTSKASIAFHFHTEALFKYIFLRKILIPKSMIKINKSRMSFTSPPSRKFTTKETKYNNFWYKFINFK